MPVSAADIADALRRLRREGTTELLEQVGDDRVRVWWTNPTTFALNTVRLALADLAAFEHGEVPPGLPEPEQFSVAQQREAVQADQGRVTAHLDQLHAEHPDHPPTMEEP